MSIPTIVGVGAGTSGTGDITPAYPAGYTAVLNDIAVTIIESATADTINPPTNWAQVVQSNQSGGTAPTKLTAIWRRLTASEAAPTIVDPGGANDHMGGRMIILRGCITTGNPWDFATGSLESVADTSVSIAAGTTLGPNRLVMAAFATGQDIASTAGTSTWANASLSSVTERMDNWVSAGGGGGFTMMTGGKATTGSTGACTATLLLTANFKAQFLVAFIGAPIPVSVGQVVETNTARPITTLFTDAARVVESVFYNEDSAQPLTVTKPAGFTTGEILVAIIHQHSNSDTTLTTPSGWAQQGSSLNGTNSQAKVFSIPFSGGLPASWDFGYGATADVCLALLRIVGADTTPVISVVSANTTSLTSSFDSSTITPNGTKDLLICSLGDISSGSAFSANVPTGMVDVGQTQAAGTFMALKVATLQLRSGSATGAKTWTSILPTSLDGGTFSVVVKTSSGSLSAAVGMVTETEFSQTVTRHKTRAASQVVETQTTQVITRRKTLAVSQVSQTNTANSIIEPAGLFGSVGQVVSTNTVQSVFARKTRAVSQVTESNTAQVVNEVKSRTILLVTETDLVQSITGRKTLTVSQVSQVNTAQNVVRLKVKAIGLITETDTIQAITGRKVATVGLVSATNIANAISHSKLKILAQVTQTNIVQSIINPSAPLVVGQIVEVESSRVIVARKIMLIGQISSTDTSRPMLNSKMKLVGQVSSIDNARQIVRFVVPLVVQVNETDFARQISGGTAAQDIHGWLPLVGLHCVYLEQKTVSGNIMYVKRTSVKIIGFASDGYPILRCRQSGVTYGSASVGVRPRSTPDSNEVGVYVSF